MTKNLKFLLFSSLVALGAMTSGAATEIATAAEFIAAMSVPDGEYVLTADIDLTGSGYTSVALFSGSLDGAGHAITGLGSQSLVVKLTGSITALTIDGTASGVNTERAADNAGIFCDAMENATLEDCSLRGYTLRPTAARAGSIGLMVGKGAGVCTLVRCIVESDCLMESTGGNIGNNMGGLIGYFDTDSRKNEVVLSIEDCTNNAAIRSVGENALNASATGGIIGSVSRSSYVDTTPEVRVTRCVNNGSFTAVNGWTSSNFGGIVGMVGAGSPLKLTLTGCINTANAVLKGAPSNALGGMLARSNRAVLLEMTGCVNRGNLGYWENGSAGASTCAGGLVGEVYNLWSSDSILIRNCANYGDVAAVSAAGFVALIVDSQGSWDAPRNKLKFQLLNSANYGKTEGTSAGEAFAKIQFATVEDVTADVDNCWTATDAYYALMPEGAVFTKTRCQTAETGDAAALAALNEVAETAEGYAKWRLGKTTGHPELGIAGAGGVIVDPIFVHDEPVVDMSMDGRTATLAMSVSDCNLTGTLKLYFNDALADEWPLSAGRFSKAIPVKKGKDYTFAFVWSGEVDGTEVADSFNGVFTATAHIDWFDVKFADAGYVYGANWIAESKDASGGLWFGAVAGDTELKESSRTVVFSEDFGGAITYKPRKRSEPGADARISGMARVSEADKSRHSLDAQFALAFEGDPATASFFPTVCVNGKWTRFGETGFAKGAWVGYSVVVDHSSADAPRIRVTVGSDASDWMPISVERMSITGVRFAGGEFGDFSAYYLSRGGNGLMLLVR